MGFNGVGCWIKKIGMEEEAPHWASLTAQTAEIKIVESST